MTQPEPRRDDAASGLRRLCFALDLVDDAALIARYEAMHAPGAVWPEVVADIRAVGVEEMEIWRAGDRMVMIASVAPDYPRPRIEPPRVAEWEALMGTFQRALICAEAGEKWVPMRRIFCLDEQDGA